MKPLATFSVCAALTVVLAVAGAVAGSADPTTVAPGTPQYDANGRLLFPTDYREWVFLSSGLNMSYNPGPATAGMDMFGNIFAPRAAYEAFKKTGVWPDKTVLILENRAAPPRAPSTSTASSRPPR